MPWFCNDCHENGRAQSGMQILSTRICYENIYYTVDDDNMREPEYGDLEVGEVTEEADPECFDCGDPVSLITQEEWNERIGEEDEDGSIYIGNRGQLNLFGDGT